MNKKLFLKRFFIFKNMSDTALTSLVKSMVEHKCSKGQVILREQLDLANNIYLVKNGEF